MLLISKRNTGSNSGSKFRFQNVIEHVYVEACIVKGHSWLSRNEPVAEIKKLMMFLSRSSFRGITSDESGGRLPPNKAL
jgi:hypothetical protein